MKDNTKENGKNQVLLFESVDYIKKSTTSFVESKKRSSQFLDYLTDTEYFQEAVDFSMLSDVEKVGLKPLFRLSTINDIQDCGSWLEFREYTSLDKITLHNANFCHRHKLCKSCAMRRSAKQIQKYHRIITTNQDLMSKNWYYIVLPVKHNSNEDFNTVYNRVDEAISKIRKARRNKRGKTFFNQFDGVMMALEVTKSSNGWNIHLNLLCCSDDEVEDIYKKGNTFVQDDLIDNWKKVTDNDSFIVSINKLNFNDDDELKKNLLEIFKYTLKFSDMNNQDLLDVYVGTYGKRLLRGWGIFHNIKEAVDMSDNELIGEEYIELILRFVDDSYIEYSRVKKISELRVSPYRKKQLPISRVVKKSKFIEIVHQDKNGYTMKKFIKKNLSAISDYEIFAKTMNSKAPQVNSS